MNPWAGSLTKYWHVFRLATLELTSFRLSFLLSFMTTPVIFVVYYYLWSLAFSWKGNLQDYTFPLLLTGLMTVTVIRVMIGANGAGESVEKTIQRGEVLVYLVRPMNYFWYQFSFFVGKTLPKWIVGALLVALFHFYFLHAIPALPKILMASLLVGLGYFVFFELLFLTGIAAFWFGETWGFRNMMNHMQWLLGGALVPTTFFPASIQVIAFLLPFHHAMFIPSEILMGRVGVESFLQSVVMLIIWAILLYFVQEKVWNAGLKHHDGKG